MLLTHRRFKHALTRIGGMLSERTIYHLNGVLNYLEVGHWMRRKGFDTSRRFKNRYELFDFAATQLCKRRVLYMEFGVAAGASMRYWSQLLDDPEAKLHGFDSFQGLPSAWILTRPKHHFSTSGEPPLIDDPRVRFFEGWFHETLPTYEWPEHDCLFVNFDADLYSSTAFVLNAIRERMPAKTFLYFDEFNHRADELRAFDEFLETTGMRFRLLGATLDLAGVLFERQPEATSQRDPTQVQPL